MKKDQHLKKVEFVKEFGTVLLSLQKEGYLILSPKNEICEKIELTGFKEEFGLCVDGIVYYSDDMTINNGYHTNLNNLKKELNKFRIINPKNIENVKRTQNRISSRSDRS